MLRSALVLTLLALPAAAGLAQPSALEQGDRAWARRAEGAAGQRADPGPIGEAVAAYEKAAAEAPEAVEPRWKLLRALYFEGEFVAAAREDKLAVFDHARQVAEQAEDLLARRVGGRKKLDAMDAAEKAKAFSGDPDAAPVFFWSAVDWGLWGENVGRLKAARQGVGGRIRDDSQAVIALDPAYESGGGHRLLGRLHAVAPKIPFFTGWVDRDTAIAELEKAVEIGPEEPYNGLYLAEVLLDRRPASRARAIAILGELVRRTPRPDHAVEDSKVIADARRALAEARGGDG